MFENDMLSYFYYGYVIIDFYKVDLCMGSNVFYKILLVEVKEYGIGLVMDMVFNYFGLLY